MILENIDCYLPISWSSSVDHLDPLPFSLFLGIYSKSTFVSQLYCRMTTVVTMYLLYLIYNEASYSDTSPVRTPVPVLYWGKSHLTGF